MRTKSVDVSKWGFNEPVVLKTLTFKERRTMQDEAVKESGMRIVGDQMVGTLKTGFLQLLMLERSIKSAPFPFNREGIDSLDDDLAQYLLKEVDELNSPLVSETKDA
jgi:hypothetical protein